MDFASSEEKRPLEKREKVAELVRRVLEGTREERDEAFKALIDLMDPVIDSVAAKFRIRDPEFKGDVQAKVFKKLTKFNPAQRFEAWVCKIAQNQAIDRARDKHRRFTVPFSAVETQARYKAAESKGLSFAGSIGDRVSEVRPLLDRVCDEEPFCSEQIAKLTELPAKRRIIGLAVAGLHTKIPPATWKEWCQEAGLGEEFPPQAVESCITYEARVQKFAELLGLSESGIRQHVLRSRKLLREAVSKE
jgi:RNA polymerase sigma factor (sigma-70 family)